MGAKRRHNLFASVAIASVDQNVSALIGQPVRHEPTNAIGRIGDQNHFAFRVHV